MNIQTRIQSTRLMLSCSVFFYTETSDNSSASSTNLAFKVTYRGMSFGLLCFQAIFFPFILVKRDRAVVNLELSPILDNGSRGRRSRLIFVKFIMEFILLSLGGDRMLSRQGGAKFSIRPLSTDWSSRNSKGMYSSYVKFNFSSLDKVVVGFVEEC